MLWLVSLLLIHSIYLSIFYRASLLVINCGALNSFSPFSIFVRATLVGNLLVSWALLLLGFVWKLSVGYDISCNGLILSVDRVQQGYS